MKKNKNNKFTICKIQLCFCETKHISISLNFVTGVVLVKGTACVEWVTSEFTKVSDIARTHINVDEINVPVDESNNELTLCDTLKEDNVFTPSTPSELELEIQNIWSTIEKLENSIKNMEISITDLSNRVDRNEVTNENKYVFLENKFKGIETRLDNKITLFQEEMEKEVNLRLDNMQKKVDNKISSMKQVIGDFKISVQNQVNEVNLKNKVTESEHNENGDCINTNTTLSELRESNKSMYEELNTKVINLTHLLEDLQSSNSTKNNIPYVNDNITIQQEHKSESEEVTDEYIDGNTEIIMCFDSNRKYVNFRKLWTLKGTQVKVCGNWDEVNKVIDDKKTKYTNLKYFFTNVGCNDMDINEGDVVFAKIKNTVEKLKSKYPDIKVIVSEITPRMDERDTQVEVTNTLLNQFLNRSENTFVVMNKNLRNPDFFEDAKHIRQSCIARFASNIKRALHKAYGTQPYKQNSGYVQRDREYVPARTNYARNTHRNEFEEFKHELLKKITAALG